MRVVERCVKRRTMNLRVADLLKEQIQSHKPSVQLESASSKRKAASWYCFHETHTQPTMWSECKCISRHRSNALFVTGSLFRWFSRL
jgi:hypothetical protein